ncbi:sulfatase family protein [Alteromonas ponticola]|uniref:Sulfatase-like hydrolase/transferase n=1 Tax=Alteromonas ponticola TaxID=2720613 RepID=A0ABX1R0Y7_9ALTE|nr:sulfatase-like hydrolase/transferase [Alteromonas ponticola]NMH59393.1 sulfatase-like hydrolase/transferase [Alteromonas ponticola]
MFTSRLLSNLVFANLLPVSLFRLSIFSVLAFFLTACGSSENEDPQQDRVADERPNIIVIFTDDQGYADVGAQNVVSDILTPNIDELAASGVRFENGYVTAPQCTPSRAGLLTGIYQQRFGLDNNYFTPMDLSVTTIAERLKGAGYATGMAGKWNIDIDNNSDVWGAQNYPSIVPFKATEVPFEVRREYFPDNRGFDDVFAGSRKWYWRNFTKEGKDAKADYVEDNEYRLDLVSKAAVQFIHRHHDEPFFLYVAPFGPHVPLEAKEEDLALFSGDMKTRRRYGLAMMYAIDRGVGQIQDALREHGLLENTLIVYTSDNGAPTGISMPDEPLDDGNWGVWDGSVNTPLTGEKGMLTEGGIKVPFIVSWPKNFPKGEVRTEPVSTLDIGFTAAKVANADTVGMDGLDVVPLLTNQDGAGDQFQQRELYWRFYDQRAVRKGDYKYLQAGIKREYLFNIVNDPNETQNLIDVLPDEAGQLRELFWEWDKQMFRQDELRELSTPIGLQFDTYFKNRL